MDGERGEGTASWPVFVFAGFSAVWFAWSYLVMPQVSTSTGELGASVLYAGWNLFVLGAAVRWVTRPGAERLWIPLAVGLACSVFGDLLWDLIERGVIPGSNRTPSPVDLLYLPSYLALILTTVALMHRYHRTGPGSVLDTFVIAGGPVAAAFPLLVGPYQAYVTEGTLESRALNVFYPTADLLITAALVALALELGRLAVLRWLVLAFGLMLVADHIYLGQGDNYVGGGWLDWMWMTQYGLLAYVTRFRLPENLPERTPRADSLYLAGLLGCAALCPAVLVIRLATGRDDAVTDLVYAAATLALVSAVAVRLIWLVRENQRTVQRLSDALAAGEALSLELQNQARRDVVTGLPNRHVLAAEIDALGLTSQTVHSVVFLDLDDFKAVNDTYGHAAGDDLLRALSARFATEVGPGALVARLGGDEFAVLLPGTDVPPARDLARRMLEGLRDPLLVDGNRITVTATAGVAGIGPGYGPASDALARADLAMYAAKRAGKDRVLSYAQEMRDQVLGDAEIAAELAGAVHAGEITAHFQPVVDLGTGRVRGAEALARWEHEGRSIPPDVFLPVAEQRGLISEIDLQVLELALSWVRDWQRVNPAMRVAFNMSSALLGRDDVVEQVLATLERHGLPGTALTVEITEQSVVTDPVGAAAKLQALRAQGIWIALDDFGTGYSSLSYLHRLPVDVMKLDRSFVVEGVVDGTPSRLLDLVVDLGRKLGMEVLAEGVETSEQLSAVRAAGCVSGQGWLFARAVPAPQLGVLLAGSLTPSQAPPTVPIPIQPRV